MTAIVRVLVFLVLVAASAGAQPRDYGGGTWSPNSGWDIPTGQEQLDAVWQQHDERVRKMREDFEASKKRMDDDFASTSSVMWGFFVFLCVVLVISMIVSFVRSARRPRVQWQAMEPSTPEPVSTQLAPVGSIDVSVLRIAIDGRASKFVQTELAAIVKTYPGDTGESRARRLRELSITLRRVRDSWIYGGADNDPVRPRDEALAAVARHVDEARSRLKQPAAATPTSSTPAVGLILVSIIVAARGELLTITDLATGEDLRRALEAAVDRAAGDLLAVEVVWMPEESGRQLSSVDLEAHYRKAELHPLGGARVGKTFCTYCGGPFPMELVTCPHCGAPAREARAS
jgi:uncharacterized membrane protein